MFSRTIFEVMEWESRRRMGPMIRAFHRVVEELARNTPRLWTTVCVRCEDETSVPWFVRPERLRAWLMSHGWMREHAPADSWLCPSCSVVHRRDGLCTPSEIPD